MVTQPCPIWASQVNLNVLRASNSSICAKSHRRTGWRPR
jgi:hypothetical protein